MTGPEGSSTQQDHESLKKVDYLARVLKQNGYPANFFCNPTAPSTQKKKKTDRINPDKGQKEKGPLVVIPYGAGMSKDIKHVCKKFNIRVVFKSLRSMLTM